MSVPVFNTATVGTDPTPDFGAAKKSQPIVRQIKFQGYEQRASFGINNNPKIWSLQWTALSNANADLIEAFFDARAGIERFYWTPLDDTTQYSWVCREWNRTHNYADICTITASFEQVFEP